MAHTVEGAETTEQHRLAQVALTAYVVSNVREAFSTEVDADDISGSFAGFVRRVLPLLLRSRRASRRLSEDYLRAFREAELQAVVKRKKLRPPAGDPLSVPVSRLRDALEAPADGGDLSRVLPPADEVTRQLYVNGAAVVKKRIKDGKPVDEALRVGETVVASTAAKMVGDGGRAVIEDEVTNRRNGAIGYCRVPDADPCPFCAMLASRGAVYRSDAFVESNGIFAGDGKFKVHNGCDCTLEPVYGRRVTDLPAGVDKLAKEWADIASGRDDPFAYWRRFKESGTLPGDERSGSLGTDDVYLRSAKQLGRERKRGDLRGTSKKKVSKMDRGQRLELMREQQKRLEGLKSHLAELEARGMSTGEPGPARYVAQRIKTVRHSIVTLSETLY